MIKLPYSISENNHYIKKTFFNIISPKIILIVNFGEETFSDTVLSELTNQLPYL